MSSVALLQKNPNPTDADIAQSLQGNVCRCGTLSSHCRGGAGGGESYPRAGAMSGPDEKLVTEPERYEFRSSADASL